MLQSDFEIQSSTPPPLPTHPRTDDSSNMLYPNRGNNRQWVWVLVLTLATLWPITTFDTRGKSAKYQTERQARLKAISLQVYRPITPPGYTESHSIDDGQYGHPYAQFIFESITSTGNFKLSEIADDTKYFEYFNPSGNCEPSVGSGYGSLERISGKAQTVCSLAFETLSGQRIYGAKDQKTQANARYYFFTRLNKTLLIFEVETVKYSDQGYDQTVAKTMPVISNVIDSLKPIDAQELDGHE